MNFNEFLNKKNPKIRDFLRILKQYALLQLLQNRLWFS